MTADGNIVFLRLNHKIIAIRRQYLTLEADLRIDKKKLSYNFLCVTFIERIGIRMISSCLQVLWLS